jgi:hypothetical protein
MNTRIVFSPSQRRPGCVLLQAAMGGDVDSGTFHDLFPVETWIIEGTDDMAPYPIDEHHSLAWLSTIAKEAVGYRRPDETTMQEDNKTAPRATTPPLYNRLMAASMKYPELGRLLREAARVVHRADEWRSRAVHLKPVAPLSTAPAY